MPEGDDNQDAFDEPSPDDQDALDTAGEDEDESAESGSDRDMTPERSDPEASTDSEPSEPVVETQETLTEQEKATLAWAGGLSPEQIEDHFGKKTTQAIKDARGAVEPAKDEEELKDPLAGLGDEEVPSVGQMRAAGEYQKKVARKEATEAVREYDEQQAEVNAEHMHRANLTRLGVTNQNTAFALRGAAERYMDQGNAQSIDEAYAMAAPALGIQAPSTGGAKAKLRRGLKAGRAGIGPSSGGSSAPVRQKDLDGWNKDTDITDENYAQFYKDEVASKFGEE